MQFVIEEVGIKLEKVHIISWHFLCYILKCMKPWVDKFSVERNFLNCNSRTQHSGVVVGEVFLNIGKKFLVFFPL